MGRIFPYIMENKKNVWNHQPLISLVVNNCEPPLKGFLGQWHPNLMARKLSCSPPPLPQLGVSRCPHVLETPVWNVGYNTVKKKGFDVTWPTYMKGLPNIDPFFRSFSFCRLCLKFKWSLRGKNWQTVKSYESTSWCDIMWLKKTCRFFQEKSSVHRLGQGSATQNWGWSCCVLRDISPAWNREAPKKRNVFQWEHHLGLHTM